MSKKTAILFLLVLLLVGCAKQSTIVTKEDDRFINPEKDYIEFVINNIDGVEGSEFATQGKNDNGLLEKEDGCSSVLYFQYAGAVDASDSQSIADRGTVSGGCIEVFKDVESAQERVEYLEKLKKLSGGCARLSSIVIRSSTSLSAETQTELQETIISAFMKYPPESFTKEEKVEEQENTDVLQEEENSDSEENNLIETVTNSSEKSENDEEQIIQDEIDNSDEVVEVSLESPSPYAEKEIVSVEINETEQKQSEAELKTPDKEEIEHDDIVIAEPSTMVSQDNVEIESDTKNSTNTSNNFETGSATQPGYYYIVNKKNGKIHNSGCRSLPKEHNQIIFSTLEEVLAQGYSDYCGNCMK